MKASTRNKARGNVNIVKGDTKIATGKVVRSKLLEAKGRAQVIVGKLQKSVAARQKAKGD